MGNLLTSTTNRQLQRSIKLAGFEIFDLLVIFSYLSVFSLLLGSSSLKIPIAWGGAVFIALLLFFTKRNKPENYLIHKLRFWLKPGTYYANSFDLEFQKYIKD